MHVWGDLGNVSKRKIEYATKETKKKFLVDFDHLYTIFIYLKKTDSIRTLWLQFSTPLLRSKFIDRSEISKQVYG